MPSIYNHENACWGIRRSSCDMFHYDLNDEFNSSKLGERTFHSSENNCAPNSTFVQYSVSGNGYYGYQPHKSAPTTMPSTEIAMDIEDIDMSPSNSAVNDSTTSFGCDGMNTQLQPNNASRKRHLDCSSMDGSKRIRQGRPKHFFHRTLTYHTVVFCPA
jgi:hypothetical protein